jgi:hypothetical protein
MERSDPFAGVLVDLHPTRRIRPLDSSASLLVVTERMTQVRLVGRDSKVTTTGEATRCWVRLCEGQRIAAWWSVGRQDLHLRPPALTAAGHEQPHLQQIFAGVRCDPCGAYRHTTRSDRPRRPKGARSAYAVGSAHWLGADPSELTQFL